VFPFCWRVADDRWLTVVGDSRLLPLRVAFLFAVLVVEMEGNPPKKSSQTIHELIQINNCVLEKNSVYYSVNHYVERTKNHTL